MIQITFSAADRTALHREIRAYLEPESGRGSVAAAPESGAGVTLLRKLVGRIPRGRVARDVLREAAQATVDGRVADYDHLVAKYAEGSGQRFGGYTQSIKKAEVACAYTVYEWDPVLRGFRVPLASDACAILELLEVD